MAEFKNATEAQPPGQGEMSFSLRYFAILREQRGLSDETISTTARTPLEIYDALSRQYGFTLPAGRIRVAVNDQFDSMDRRLNDGDRIVFVPPVAGG